MSLSNKAKIKLSKIGKYPTNLYGYYQYQNDEEAIEVINRFHECINDNGSFNKNRNDANCDPNYQQLSAAIDYLLFKVKREISPYKFKK